ncbi:electron transport complex subunit RsxC [Candidatus Woesearchaeota archaeon]|nr:electron transport complex subunit RsxC [Candidatus Woesearchaeota archaeon]
MLELIRGVHPPERKISKESAIKQAELPKKVVIPLSQHIGAPCKPIVKVGDEVKIGQTIAESDAFCSAPIHASISGKVTEIAKKPHPSMGDCMAIVIESNGRMIWDESIKARENVDALSSKELIDIVKQAGIVGMGGAMFPTFIKYCPPKGKKIDTIILNGAECEPMLTCDHRTMLKYPDDIVKGLKLIMKMAGAEEAIIGIEDNKPDAIKILKERTAKEPAIKVVGLKTKYPQGAEKMLIYSLTKRKVPCACLPLDVGIVVNNVGTAKAIHDAVYQMKPLIERVVTVTGDVKKPQNLLVKIGTSFSELIRQCDGFKGEPAKIINGGPMMGIAQATEDVPVIKGTSGILIQNKKSLVEEEERVCIRCGKCVQFCPMEIMPTTITNYAKHDLIDLAEESNAMDCIECGCCAYECPSKIPLVHWIKYAKSEISKKRAKEKEQKKK